MMNELDLTKVSTGFLTHSLTNPFVDQVERVWIVNEIARRAAAVTQGEDPLTDLLNELRAMVAKLVAPNFLDGEFGSGYQQASDSAADDLNELVMKYAGLRN